MIERLIRVSVCFPIPAIPLGPKKAEGDQRGEENAGGADVGEFETFAEALVEVGRLVA